MDSDEVEVKTVKGRIKILRVLEYQGVKMYIRQVDHTLFEYMCPINGEIWSSYMVFTPQKGRKTLTSDQVHAAEQMILAGAMATVENALGIDVSTKTKNQVEEFLEIGEKAFGDGAKVAQS